MVHVLMKGSFYFGLLLSLALPFAGYFIRILFPQHDHVFHERYTNYFMVNSTEMLTHAHAIGTRLLLLQPGYEAREKVRQLIGGANAQKE